MKVFASRAFKSLDKRLDDLEHQYGSDQWVHKQAYDLHVDILKEQGQVMMSTQITLTELKVKIEALELLRDKVNTIDALRAEFLEKFLPKSDFTREIEIMTSQIEGIYRKIDHLDEKLDKKMTQLRGEKRGDS